jgi:phage shock protein A
MSFFRKLFSSRAAEPAKDTGPADQLRAEIASLEAEMAESQRALADLEAKMRAAETRAMEAIRAGDQQAARASLLEQGAHAEKAGALADDLKVLRAILDECHDFINKMAADAPAPRDSSSS